MDVRGAGQVRGLVGDMSGHGSRVLSTSEAVTKRRRLDNSLVGELLVRGSNNREAWRGLVSSRHARRLGGELGDGILVGAVAFGRLLVQSRFDNVSLLLSNRHTSLELLLHDGVLGDKARGETRNTDFLDTEAFAGGHRPRRAGLVRFECVL